MRMMWSEFIVEGIDSVAGGVCGYFGRQAKIEASRRMKRKGRHVKVEETHERVSWVKKRPGIGAET